MRDLTQYLINMKAKFVCAAICAVLLSTLPLVSVSCESETASLAERVSYDLTVTVDEAENKTTVDMTVTVPNVFEEGLKELVFSFYPDAFTLKSPPPVDETMISAAYPYGINAGGYTFLQAGGENVKSVSICETRCRITVALEKPLAIGESAVVRFSYDLTLPLCNTRYGYNDFSVNLTFFYPVLCRYDAASGGFEFNDYIATGDPFVFDVAEYSLALDCPEAWAVACSAPETRSENGVRYYHSRSARDLSLFLAPDAEVTTVTKGGYTATAIHDGSFGYAATYAADALDVFSEAFGELPEKQYYIVFTPFMTAGAEFSNAAIVSSGLSFAEVEKTVAHEVSHQWWYNLVGSDQVNAPWQDEALAQWSTLLYFGKRGMKSYADTLLKGYSDFYKDYLTTQRSLGESALCDVNRATTEYRDQTDYFATVYCKALLAVEITAQSVTRDGLCKALSLYVKNNCLSFAYPEDLYEALNSYREGAGALLRNSLNVSPY